ncbi:MAG: acireductone synthase [Fimbriimonadaceae bacterium]
MVFAAYLLDIEGTTTPIDFVTRTLFPYARKYLSQYVQSGISSEILVELEQEPDWSGSRDLVEYLQSLMDQDRKSTGLKMIQGQIWESGYASGELHAEIYPEVELAMRNWIKAGATLHIFSSGSVLAQRLLFGHLPEGDLTPLITSYFDTTTGPKRVPESYGKIANSIGRNPAEILFLSDIIEEVDAARAVGMTATQVLRGTEVNDFPRAISSFLQIS